MLQKAWYSKELQHAWVLILLPFSLLFYLISGLRRALYRRGVLSSYQSRLPVVVVGNISVGGNGKTPLVLAIAQYFTQHGIACAVLSRGYGGKQQHFPYCIQPGDEAETVGDEPLLMHQRLHASALESGKVEIVIDPKRARGAAYIEKHTEAQVIICDDGLQHYALNRDFELCVIDGRGFGNGLLLPTGPLREGKKRLKSLDGIVCNGKQSSINALPFADNMKVFAMDLKPSAWVRIYDNKRIDIDEAKAYFSKASSIAALAGIGDPKRFFTTLESVNVHADICVALPDHHQFSQKDVPKADLVLMTEKDAVKCRAFAKEHYWYLEVNAQLPPALFKQLDAIVQTKT